MLIRWAVAGSVGVVFSCVAMSIGCGQTDAPSSRPGLTGVQATRLTLTPNENAAILIPQGRDLADVAISAGEGITLDSYASVAPASPGGVLFNAGAATTDLGVSSQTAEVLSVGPVALSNLARVEGDVTSASSILQASGATITGTASAFAPVATRSVVLPLVVSPGSERISLRAGASRELAPGRYASITTEPRSTVRLSAGRYEFDSVDLHATARLAVDASDGPVILLVRSTLALAGEVTTIGREGSFMLGFTGTQPARIEAAFHGSVFAPYASLSLRAQMQSMGIVGSFFARRIRVEEQTAVRFEPFQHWSRLFGLRPILTCLSRARVDSAAGLFGYENETSSPIEIALGPDNRLDGASFNAPPTVFSPGLTPYAFYGYFDPSRGSATWSVLGTAATADGGSIRCTATDVVPGPTGDEVVTIDAPGEPSDAARARAVPNFYGPGYTTVPMAAKSFSPARGVFRTLAAPTGPRFRIRVTNVTRGDDGCGDNDPVFRSVVVAGQELGPRDMQDCAAAGNCNELFDASLDLSVPTVEAAFDVWDDDAFLCGSDDHQFRARLIFDARTGATLGGSLDGFEPAESKFIDPGSSCLRTRDGDGFCWSVEVIRPTEVCFEWPADFVDSGPWSDGAAEDFFAARGVQAFPATRALARVVLADETHVRYSFEGILDGRGCIAPSQLPNPEDWARGSNFRVEFSVRPVMCGDPSGVQCAQNFSMGDGAANIVVADSESAGRPNFCTVYAERESDAPAGCRTVSAAQNAFASWPPGKGPELLRINANQVGTQDSITPTTRVAAVVSHALARETGTGGDLSIALGLVERRYASQTPTIFANQECPRFPGTSCTDRNQLYLEPDFVQRPGVFGSNRFKFVVAHELGHFFQHSSQGTLLVNYDSDDVNPLCACRHVPPVDARHCIQSLETVASSQSEGYAHFLAAKIWNRTDEPNCTFAYYKEFLDTECRPGAEQCIPDPDHSELQRTRPPYPIACTARVRWRNTHCLDSTATPDKLRQGVELDWLAFYWGINRGTDATTRWTTRLIHDAYVSACGGQACRGTAVAWPQLRAGAAAVSSATQNDIFNEVGRDARVDDQL
jgi:hypothetical protein